MTVIYRLTQANINDEHVLYNYDKLLVLVS